MTIRLEITAEKPEEFLFNAAKTLALITGRQYPFGQQTTAAVKEEPIVVVDEAVEVEPSGSIGGEDRAATESAQSAASDQMRRSADPFPAGDDVGFDTASEPQPAPPEPKKRGRPPRTATTAVQPEQEVQEDPSAEVSTNSTPTDPAPSVEDITNRIREVIKAEETREYARRGLGALDGKKPSNPAEKEQQKSVMEHGVRYTMKLLAEFDAKSRSTIKEADYPKFMERSQAYLDGSAV